MACPRNFINTTQLPGGHPPVQISNASNTPNDGLSEQMRCPYSLAGSSKTVNDRVPDPPEKMACPRNSTTANNSAAAYTPAEAIELVCHAGEKKGTMQPDKIFLSAVSAGGLLSIGCAVTLSTMTAPWYQENAPGLIKMIGALVFPVGLMMIILTGADLFTASTMYTSVAALQGRLPVSRMFLHWLLCWWGNLAGCLFTMAIIFGYGGVFDTEPYREEVITFVTKKQINPQFHQIFLRAIGCNWLVCLGCYLAIMAKDLSSKVIGLWWPIFAFVALGLDHVVANMFFIPLGLFLRTPGLTVGLYIWKGMIPGTLGNIIGGAVFCGCYYWWMWLFKEPATKLKGLVHSTQGEHKHLRDSWFCFRGRMDIPDEEQGKGNNCPNSTSNQAKIVDGSYR